MVVMMHSEPSELMMVPLQTQHMLRSEGAHDSAATRSSHMVHMVQPLEARVARFAL